MRVSLFSILLFVFLVPVLGLAAGVPFDPADTHGTWDPMDSNSLWLVGQSANPATVAIGVVNWALMFLGVASAAFILYAGFVWFLARDNEEQAQKAIDILKGGIIGLFLVLMSYGIAYTVYTLLVRAT